MSTSSTTTTSSKPKHKSPSPPPTVVAVNVNVNVDANPNPNPSVDDDPPQPPPPHDDHSTDPTEQEDIIEMEILNQILDLDEDDTHEFSRGMAWAYFSQAAETFDEMDAAYAAKDLAKLSSLGHFLKGSSAALGVCRVQESCEQIQHYGDLRDEEADRDLSADKALEKIGVTLSRVKLEYAAAELWLKDYYAKFPPA